MADDEMFLDGKSKDPCGPCLHSVNILQAIRYLLRPRLCGPLPFHFLSPALGTRTGFSILPHGLCKAVDHRSAASDFEVGKYVEKERQRM